MPEFLKKASCRGRRPLHLVPRRQIPRPNLIAKLLRERHVARFIVAPDGFGKTGLAMEYADTVFSFEHVVWLDGRSPCFLRDLDRGIIARTLLEGDPQPFLVVIDDVPLLDPERAELLSDELDLLLDRDCEVMVACMPSRDAFARHRDRIKLTAVDLLLTDEEVDLLRTPGERSSDPASTIAPACRVATFVWGSDEERAGFLSAVLGEELPADLLLPLFVMASLGKGTFEDVAAFGPFGPDQDALLAEQYPYLGIDSRSGRFEAAPFEVEALAGAFARKLGALADRSLFSDASTLVVRLGDALAMRGEHERACDFVRLLASRAPRASWLAKHGAALLEAACLVPACEVHRSLSGETAGKGALLSAHEAVRRALLGDRQAACVAARKAVRDRNAPSSVRMTGALVLAQCAEADERRRADKLVVSLLAAAGIADAAEAPREAVCAKAPEDRGWLAAGCVHAQLRKAGCPEAARVWLDWHDDGARGSFLKQSAAEVLRQAAASGAGEARSIELDRLGAFVRKEVSQASRGTLGLGDALAGIAYERACERGAIAVPALDAQAALAVRRIEMRLFSQRNACERLELERLERERVFVATHPDAYREEGRATRLPKLPSSVPALTVNLFGGLDVLMGDERVDPSLFSRQKVKTLLALLVLHNGREFSRDKLVGLLWPDSEIMHGRKNFYGIWAMLRRALTLPSGECPYLIRQQQGLRLDASLLTSDVAQLEDVCRTLLFERPGYGGWAQVYSQVNDRFSDDLLPSENGNDALASLRVDYRNRLVDALVAASTRLVAAGEAQEGLWFAGAPARPLARRRLHLPHAGPAGRGAAYGRSRDLLCLPPLPHRRAGYRPLPRNDAPLSQHHRNRNRFRVTDGERNNEHRLRKWYIMDIITISLGSILTFECDPKKSVANLQKHGIDFDEAQQLWEGIYIKAPARKRGERRYAVVGVLRGVHWTAIATDRGDRIRIISVRRATEQERIRYEQRKDNL